MRNPCSTKTERESQMLTSLRNRLASYTPMFIAVILGEIVFATGLWLRTTEIHAYLASSVVICISLVGIHLLEERREWTISESSLEILSLLELSNHRIRPSECLTDIGIVSRWMQFEADSQTEVNCHDGFMRLILSSGHNFHSSLSHVY